MAQVTFGNFDVDMRNIDSYGNADLAAFFSFVSGFVPITAETLYQDYMMARVRETDASGNSIIVTMSGNLASYSVSSMSIVSNGITAWIDGNFVIDPSTYDLSGTVTGESVRYTSTSALIASISGIAVFFTTTQDTLPAIDDITALAGTDSILGGSGSDYLLGYAGNDTVNGGAGHDTLDGGAGDDTYVVDSAGDVVKEELNGGTDAIQTTLAAYSLAAQTNLENLTYVGSASFSGIGNDAANVLTGGSGGDTLDGGIGNDTLYGGSGIGSDRLDGGSGSDVMQGGDGYDTYVVDSTGDSVWDIGGVDTVLSSVSFSLAGTNADILTLTGTSSINATGDGRYNELNGNDGNNVLDGGGGGDALRGGKGDDLYIVRDYSDAITEMPNEGIDSVLSDVSFTHTHPLHANVENLTLTGSADNSATGNDLANMLTGNDGSNMLEGGLGADTLIGGAGNDNYYQVDASDTVIESPGGGTDGIWCTASFSLAALPNVENLRFNGPATGTLTGNDADNWIVGGDLLIGCGGNDTLDGMGGISDTLIGGTGDDIYRVWSATDIIQESAGEGTDVVLSYASYTLAANLENLTLYDYGSYTNIDAAGNELGNLLAGTSAINLLDGLAGNDTLIGAGGNDSLDGGAGFDAAQYSGNKADYIISKGPGYGYTVADANPGNGSDGADTLFAVETLQFADGPLALPSRILERVATPAIWFVIDTQHDYNSDGVDDLWWKQANGSTAIWVMDGRNTQAPHSIGPCGGWTVFDAVTDQNLDGKADLVWHHADGSTMLWLNATGMAVAQGIEHDAGWPLS